MIQQENIRKRMQNCIIASVIGIMIDFVGAFLIRSDVKEIKIIGVYIIVFSIVFLIHIPISIGYIKTQAALPDQMKEMIAYEMDDPRTLANKKLKLFLTPNFLVSLGPKLVIVPYGEITWAYVKKEHTRGGSIKSIMFFKRDFTRWKVATINVARLAAEPNMLNDVLEVMRMHNPQMIIGYTPELNRQFKEAKKRYRA